MYQWLAKPLLFLFTPEKAHRLAMTGLRAIEYIPGGLFFLRLIWGHGVLGSSQLAVEAMGVRFANPVVLAAGFDKGAEAYNAFNSMGFGAVEVGTITGVAQPGNPKPRVFRLAQDRCLLNRMGFNNCGAAVAKKRLSRHRIGIVGVNIGKTKLVEEEQAIADYVLSAKILGPLGDYVVVNVSSPNTPGLRSLQAVEKLRPLLVAVQNALVESCGEKAPPLLVKIAPDLEDSDVLAVADLALELKLAGIVATNTTLSRENLSTDPAVVQTLGAGGVSGPVLEKRALRILQLLRSRTLGKVTLIAAGGIGSSRSAWERIVAGASLVQIYTAFVYEGPALPGQLARGLLALAQENGFESIQSAVDHYAGLDPASGS